MKKILIVEDEEALRNVYVMLFQTQDFDVAQAPHGRAALDIIQTHQPDIIILDILMPVMGGIEFLENAKIKENYPNTRVLVLSNLSDPKTLSKIEKLGADKYMLKSGATPNELIATVNKLLT